MLQLAPLQYKKEPFLKKKNLKSTLTLREWGDLCIKCVHALPDFETYPNLYKLDKIIKEHNAWFFTLKNVVIPFLRDIEPFWLPHKRKFSLGRIREIIGYIKISRSLVDYLIYLLNDDTWIPCPDAGETTTEKFKLIINLLSSLTHNLKRLFFGLERAHKDLSLINARAPHLCAEKPILSTDNSNVKNARYKLNEWQERELNKLLLQEDRQEKEVSLNSFNIEAKSDQFLLKKKEDFGIITYTIIVIGNISKSAFNLLNKNPYEFEVIYTGMTTHYTIGLDRVYEQGYYYFREAILLGTNEQINTFEKVTKFFEKLAMADKTWDLLFNSLVPSTTHIFRKGHYYWLLLPKSTKGITIENWGLAKKGKSICQKDS